MKDIKIREESKGIKAIDKASVLSERMRDGFVRTKYKAEHGLYQDTDHDTPEEYATDDAEQRAKSVVRDTAMATKRTVKKGTKRLVDNLKKRRANRVESKPINSTELTVKPANNSNYHRVQTPRLKAPSADKSIKTVSKSFKTTTKGTVKATQKTIKTAERTSKAAIKTVQQTTKAAEKTARASVKATIAAVKAIIAGTKALIAAIAAGGWVAVVVVIVICLIALIAGSCFGIFFSNEDTNSGGTPMTQVVSQLNTEYYDKIEQIKSGSSYDEVEVIANDGVQAIKWNEVLAVYAVKTTTDGGTDVVTITDDKIEMLRQVLWDMNSITHTSQTTSKEVDVVEKDADGKETTVRKTISETVLTINLTHKSYTDMTSTYSLNSEQTKQLNEMMSSEYDSMWAQLLGGYSVGTGEILISNSEHIPTDIFSWALPGSHEISSQFGYRTDPFTGKIKFHGGLDIAAPAGTPILASADGVVTVANSTDSWGYGYGYHIMIKHNDTYSTLYAHCSSIAVSYGQEVKKGQIIGYVGTTGNSTGNHLHFEVYKDGERTNPLSYFK